MPTLDWLNRQDAFTSSARVPYRLLAPVSSHGDPAAENLLIQGDNLEALKVLRELLREDGSIWVTIDDNEGHYLKVLMDEVFGRGNFVTTVIWQKADFPRNSASNGRASCSCWSVRPWQSWSASTCCAPTRARSCRASRWSSKATCSRFT